MRAVVQRVTRSAVSVDNVCVASIKEGLLVLLGVEASDDVKDALYLSEKIVNLRIFEDEDSKFNLSLIEIHGEALVVSQFTLLGDIRHGRRPGFSNAARPEIAQDLYDRFVEEIKKFGIKTQKGIFGANMQVELINNGPVTLLLDSKKAF